jgi:DNA primase catalytic core
MARIAEDLIARLKAEVPLERVVAASGVELARRGKDLVARCPFHEDEEPSLVVTPSKGLWRCFGCNKGGTVIDWRMEISGESFRAAVESLVAAHLPGAVLEESEPPAVPAVEPFSAEQVETWLGCSDEELLQQVASYYRERLDVDPRGKEYLAKRDLLDEAMVGRFGIGLADRTLGLRLPLKQVKAGEQLRSRLARVGILREESGHEHLAGSLVVPIRDLSGRVVQMYGRKVTPNLRKGTPLHLYLPGSRNCVFHPEALVESDEVILCESILDALTFWSAGFRHTTCSFGVHGFTDALHEAMKSHGTRRVLLAYDRDEAGEKAACELGKKLLAEGIECFRVLFPRGMDANEYAQKVKPASKSLDLVLRRAEWMGEGSPPSQLVPQLLPVTTGNGAHPMTAEDLGAALPLAASFELADVPGDATPLPPAGEPAAAAPPSVLPALPRAEVPVEVREQEVVIALGDRRYRIRGLERNLSFDTLRINLLACRGEAFHVDTLDLYVERQRRGFIKQASLEIGCEERTMKGDLGKVLLALERLQDEQIEQALAPKKSQPQMSEPDRKAALELLSDPQLLDRILSDLERCGVVGEETNKLVSYLATISRRQSRPLAVLVQSSSAAGKSALMEAVLAFVPEEDRVSYSAMTGQSLFYMGEKDLRHKVLAIAEEEGAERAAYALKLLQSEGQLSIASTGKDPASGRLTTHEYHVEGPVAILFTTTAIDLDEELLNRCLVLSVDEGREQTRAIHRLQRQRETLPGQLAMRRRQAIRHLHQNAQRLLAPLLVVNPFAGELSFPDSCTRTRRDHEKYLGLIRAVALLFQHQRQIRTKVEEGEEVAYVEVVAADLEIANRLAHEVLGRTLDELPPQTRRLLHLLEELAVAECERLGIDRAELRFTRRWVRERTGWGDTQLKVHLNRLVELEYLAIHGASHAQRHSYELLYDGAGKDGKPFLPGLIDLASLGTMENRSGQTEDRSGQEGNRSAPGRPPVGGWSGGGRSGEVASGRETSARNRRLARNHASRGVAENGTSYSQARRSQGELALQAAAEEAR